VNNKNHEVLIMQIAPFSCYKVQKYNFRLQSQYPIRLPV